ncbi:MAG: ParB N-terminal domain-containing protein [Spirochaetales bacterium]|nr:ParB N-terminal domain-containing protein [Spirochaetales bacterium]
MQIRINEIIVKKRLRKDLGDLTELSESIKKHGLLNPVVINNKKILIAGERRLEAAKLLGWDTIPVKILDNPTKMQELEIEIDENIHRKPFNPDESIDAFVKLEKLQNPSPIRILLNKIAAFLRKLFSFLKPKN